MIEKATIRSKEEEIRNGLSNFPDSSELITYCTEVSEAITALEGVWEPEGGSSKRIAKLKEYAESITEDINYITESIDSLKKVTIPETPIYQQTKWDWF